MRSNIRLCSLLSVTVESTTISFSTDIVLRHKRETMYAVVTLTDSGEVMVAASNWLTEDKEQCYWPPFKSTERCLEAVKDRVMPEKEGKSWEKLNLCFYKECDTFEQAQEKQKEIKDCFSGIPTRQKLETTEAMSSNLSETSAVTSKMSADDNTEILQMLRDIKSIVQENSKMLKKLRPDSTVAEAPSSTSKPSVKKSKVNLPLRTVEDMHRIEMELSNATTSKTYVKHLSECGGFGAKDVIKNIMQQLMIDDLAKDFNWQGRGDKRPFSKLMLVDVIKEAASKRNVNKADCESEIKKYLLQAADRVGRKRLREQGGPGNDGEPPEKRTFLNLIDF